MSYGKSFYERKIKYLDYFEGQMRLGSGGFAKLEVREEKLRLDMTVTGLHGTDTFARDVVLCGKGRERVAGRMDITKGKGQYRQQWQDLEDIGGTGIGYWELQGIRIPLGAGREVSCRWQETERPAITQPGASAYSGKRSGAGYVQEMPGTSGEYRWERQIGEGDAEEAYMGGKAAAERYIAEEDVVERYRVVEDTGAGRTEGMDRETGYGRDETERRVGSRAESGRREENGMGGERSVENETEGGWQVGSGTEERRYEGNETDNERYDGTEERGQRLGGKEAEKAGYRESVNKETKALTEEKGTWEKRAGGIPERELVARGLSEREESERELSERERAAADRWKIEEDTEMGTISRESEIKAMERGRGEMAEDGDRGVIRYGHERYAADEETESQANGAYSMDGGRLGYMAEGDRKKQVKAAYGTDGLRTGGYAVEDGIRVQEDDRYGMDREKNMRSKDYKETIYRKEGNGSNRDIIGGQLSGSGNRYGSEKIAEGGNGYGDRGAVESRIGNEDRRAAGSRIGNEDRRAVGSRIGNEDRKGTESGNRYGDRRETENRVGYSGRKVAESSGDHKRGEKPIEEQIKPMEDKWPQLWAIYPHIRPFQDEREYLSIAPADFVLFTAASYRSVNNSFLLHGYYNYKHLILARVEKRGEIFYYIGVPGNFYEREKQVAIMFGFESFECAEEPAQAGDFGYYMMRVEL